MGEDSGQAGASGQPAEGGKDPWAPPEEHDRLSKRQGGWAEQPTVTSAPGAAPGAGTPNAPVGPPPPAPGGPHQTSGYGAQGGYAQVGYDGYGGGYGGGYAGGYGAGYGGGYAGYGQPGVGWGGPPLPQGTAVAAMVMGIVGLVLTSTCWGSFLGIFVAPVALVLGIKGRRKADRGEAGGRSYATSGFVMGIVGTVLSAVLIVVIVLVIANAEDLENDPSPGYYDALSSAAVVATAGR